MRRDQTALLHNLTIAAYFRARVSRIKDATGGLGIQGDKRNFLKNTSFLFGWKNFPRRGAGGGKKERENENAVLGENVTLFVFVIHLAN